jgi:cation diffusion facilitator family transporter
MTPPASPQDALAQREKHAAALASVIAAFALSGLKLGAGLGTGSLGILSEAAHSALDLVAAGVTFFAVRLSALPPDRKHPFGHGKVENLSALLETLLLLATCVWIAYEAVERLLHPAPVQASAWAVGVMLVSIGVDFTRSRMLLAAAKKHNSQALEADALHFSTDIWSSLVVVFGLAAQAAGEYLDPASALAGWLGPWLARADALAALAVSGIVLSVSWRLGRQAVDVLLDAGVGEAQDAVEAAVAGLPGVRDVRRVRVRQSGPASFVDMVLEIAPGLDAEACHQLVRKAREATRTALPGADVLVELRPEADAAAALLSRARAVADGFDLGVHDMDLSQQEGLLHLNLHAEVPEGLTLAQAHLRISRMEAALRVELGENSRVTTHIEPVGAHPEPGPDAPDRAEALRQRVEEVVADTPGVCDPHGLVFTGGGGRLQVSFHCRMHPQTPITLAHDRTVALEAALRARLPQLSGVTIHMEPDESLPPESLELGRGPDILA